MTGGLHAAINELSRGLTESSEAGFKHTLPPLKGKPTHSDESIHREPALGSREQLVLARGGALLILEPLDFDNPPILLEEVSCVCLLLGSLDGMATHIA